MNLYDHVGAKIREFRTAFGGGMSQEALADKIGVASNTISRWETAVYNPTLADLEKLARFFGRSLLEFLPTDDPSEDEEIIALLRAAKELDPHDLHELRRYAEYRKARSVMGGVKPRPAGNRRSRS
jgi:transcriptional regulator with XRE-family HTH domain